MNGKNQELSNWPTPRAVDGEGGLVTRTEFDGKRFKSVRLSGQTFGSKLRDAVENLENWPTPTKNDTQNTWNGARGETLATQTKTKHGGKLNPNWCEQLMGLPVGWTKIKDTDDRISRLMAIGNGVVPQTAALAWKILNKKLMTTKTKD